MQKIIDNAAAAGYIRTNMFQQLIKNFSVNSNDWDNTTSASSVANDDRLAYLETKILSFRRLEENWNGEGAPALSEELMLKALDFVKNMPLEYLDVFFTGQGTVQFDYDNSNDYLEIEMFTDHYEYFFQNGNDETEGETNSLPDLIPYVNKITSK